MVGMGDLGQLQGWTLSLGLGNELWGDARTPSSFDDEARDLNLAAVWDPVKAIPLRIDVAVKLVCPTPVRELSAAVCCQMSDDLWSGGGPLGTKPVTGEKLFTGGVPAPWAVAHVA